MKHLLFGLVLLVGCAHVPVPKATETAASKDPFADILGLLGNIEAPKAQTPPCLANGCIFSVKDEIDEDMSKDFTNWMESVKGNHITLINLNLDTPGGDVEEGYVIIHALEAAHKAGITSSCKVDGDAASMGFLILQSCDERLMTKRSNLMAHEVKVQIKGPLSQSKAQNLADMLKVSNRTAAEHCIVRMKVTIEEYLAKTTNGHEWFMDWEEAKRVGAVDQIVRF